MYRYAVFQGGGVKGMALVGALSAAERQGARFEGVGGTSAGAIVAALYAAGYSAHEMRQVMTTDFASLLDRRGWGWAPWAIYQKLGLYRGRRFYDWLQTLLRTKGVRKFADCRIQLRVVGCDLSMRTLVVFDAQSHPSLDVAEAVRASMSIPLVFEPVRMGERLMVDGGVLSNFPLSLFDGAETLGFRLKPRLDKASPPPEDLRSYALALAATMLEGRDNYDVESKQLAGLIEIDPGPIAATQFDLKEEQKVELHERGVAAAAQFFSNRENVNEVRTLTINGSPGSIKIRFPENFPDDSVVRFSISGLVRIESENSLMLVKGNRIDQFQPVGGVFKVFGDARKQLSKLGLNEDTKFPVDADSQNDLRVFLPGDSILEFIRWYLQGSGRETTPYREFWEETIDSEILSPSTFRTPAFDRIGRKVEGVRFSEHFQCYEVLIAEIFRLVATPAQQIELDRLKLEGGNAKFLWASPDLIRSRGYDVSAKRTVKVISETSSWLLDFEEA